MSTDKELLNTTKITNLRAWPPAQDREAISQFGDSEVLFISNHFDARFKGIPIQNEWHLLRAIL